MENMDIRKAASAKGVFLWEVAEKAGMNEFTLSRKLRRELSAEQKTKYFAAIDSAAAEKQVSQNG